jgi:hypothetical protein
MRPRDCPDVLNRVLPGWGLSPPTIIGHRRRRPPAMPLSQVYTNQFQIPQSAPNSPLAAKTARQPKGPPVTPQRVSRSAHQRENILRSPLTPASSASTPYHYALDGGNQSFATESSNASILVTPVHSQSFAGVRTSLATSPEVPLSLHRKNKSVADAAQNWRSRATENGIRVASAESQFADDEGVCVWISHAICCCVFIKLPF